MRDVAEAELPEELHPEEKPKPSLPPQSWQSHVIPFVLWIFLMGVMGDAAGWKYALRSALGLLALFLCKPWSWNYGRVHWKHLLASVGAGLLIYGIWILPETLWVARLEWLHRLYLRVGMIWPWELAQPLEQVRYAPSEEGWLMALARLAGSAFVISIIEEFFWRGWLTRWIDQENFLEVDPGNISNKALWIGALMFATVHQRWIAGIICGLVYGELYRRTKDIWAPCIAHTLTNFLLGLYVLWSGNYAFWA